MRALVLGVTGQDGSYLAEQLAADGYEVWGMARRPNAVVPVPVVLGDLLDQESLERALLKVRPDEVYNVAAVTAPGGGWGTPQPPLLADVTALGVLRLLEAMVACAPHARLVHASSSAVYDPQRYGLYGTSKLFAHDTVIGYRDRLHASNAVLFSHTSPRQEARFLARRVCAAAARISAGSGERIVLGDVQSRRDWGYAPDYCEAMRLIARQDTPGDWVVATGVQHSVRELVEAALAVVGISWDEAVTVDATLPEVPHEIPTHEARLATTRGIGWTPRTSWAEMIEAVVRG